MYEAEKRARRYERLYGQRLLKPLVPYVLESLPAATGDVWLDWESGSGTLALALRERLPPNGTLLACNDDRAALRVLHSHSDIERDPRCFVRQSPPDSLGLANGVVDLAIGHWRWQYIENPGAAVVELCRVVKAEGTIILSFLVPGSGGSILTALAEASAENVVEAVRGDGLTTSVVREYLRAGKVSQIEVRTMQHELVIGASSRPTLDPLLVEFLLPRWLSRAVGKEVTSIDPLPFELGTEPLTWEFKMGVATAIMASA